MFATSLHLQWHKYLLCQFVHSSLLGHGTIADLEKGSEERGFSDLFWFVLVEELGTKQSKSGVSRKQGLEIGTNQKKKVGKSEHMGGNPMRRGMGYHNSAANLLEPLDGRNRAIQIENR